MFNKRIKHEWKPYGEPIIANGKVYVVEYDSKYGMYRYVRVPSFAQLEEMEGNKE